MSSIPAASVFLFCSAVLCVVLAVYAIRQRDDAFTRSFVALNTASAIYALGYGVELASPDLAGMKLALRFEYLGITGAPLFWLSLAWSYLDSRGLPRALLVAESAICLFFLVAFQSNDAHHLFYATLDYARVDGLAIAQIGKGPLYWLFVVFLNVSIGGGVVLFFRAWRQSMRIYQRQSLCVLVGSFFPWLFHLAYQLGWSPDNIDLSPFGLAASALFFTLASFRHGILQVLPVARDLVFDGLSEGVVVLDSRGQVTDYNRAAAQFVAGLSPSCIGRRFAEVCSLPEILREMGGLPQAHGIGDSGVEVTLPLAGQPRVIEVRVSPMADRKGRIHCRALLLRDVTEKRDLLEQLHRQATTDSLTGLFNRRHLEHLAERAFLLARRAGEPMSLAVIDVDGFKEINDRQGHQAGDTVLRRIADQAQRRLRATDILGRLGGDEFVVVLPATGAEAAVEVMRELGQACQQNVGASLSIGVADLGRDCESVQMLLNRADAQLYRAKHAGRRCVMAAYLG